MNKILLLAVILLGASALYGGTDFARHGSVIVEAKTGENGAITLSWIVDDKGQGYTIFRRRFGEKDWRSAASLPKNAESWTDENPLSGMIEYKIVKNLKPGQRACSYLVSGDIRKRPLRPCLLVVEERMSKSLQFELERFTQDLINDDWQVDQITVSAFDKVTDVKDKIRPFRKENLHIILIGRVPVPYSGNIFPDGHTIHRGAWVADLYYGDFTTRWTDVAKFEKSNDSRNNNIAGDGKFDQSKIKPGAVEAAVGRIDFSRVKGGDVTGMMKRYFNKVHAYRHGWRQPRMRGLVDDNFSGSEEYFAADGWSGFSPVVGKDNLDLGQFMYDMKAERKGNYLMAYACGPGGFNSAGGVGNSSDFKKHKVQAVFTALFGSLFGDWHSPDNFMTSALAGDNWILTACWSGRPHWFYHLMAADFSMGEVTKLIQNNDPKRDYEAVTNQHYGLVHVSLLGDPTLRIYYHEPPRNIKVKRNGNNLQISCQIPDGGKVAVGWDGNSEIFDSGEFTLSNVPETATLNLKTLISVTNGSTSFDFLSQGINAPASDYTQIGGGEIVIAVAASEAVELELDDQYRWSLIDSPDAGAIVFEEGKWLYRASDEKGEFTATMLPYDGFGGMVTAIKITVE